MGCGSSTTSGADPVANGYYRHPNLKGPDYGNQNNGQQERQRTPSPVAPPPRTPTPKQRTPTPPPRSPTPPPKSPTPPPPKTPTPPPRTPTPKQEEKEEEVPPVPVPLAKEQEQGQEEQEQKEGKNQEEQKEQEKEPENQEEEQKEEEKVPENQEGEKQENEGEGEPEQQEEDAEPDAPEAIAAAAWSDPGVRQREKGQEQEEEDIDNEAEADITEGQEAGKQPTMGRMVTVIDCRANGSSLDKAEKPAVESGELWTDPEFGFGEAMQGADDGCEWRRPGEFCETPCLFADGTTRFDIGQGGAGTCWFLSILASLADKPDIIKQIIPEDAYKIGGDDYDGIFHCRFWVFGEWVDVYIDDFLPVKYDKPWGARSSTEPNEMWVSLMEKAFAKLLGGYKSAYGGWAGDAFIAMTGGLAERVEMKDVTRAELFQRVKNSVCSGAVVACSVPTERDGQMGLVGGHAYTLTGTAQMPYNGKKTSLFRVRNPWGSEKGEWTGAWSDKASEWDSVNDGCKDRLQVQGKGDGEFWMNLPDYFDYFRDTHICNFTPDFDQDGKPDGLNQVTSVFGEWAGESAAGGDAANKFNNQKFTFTVPNEGLSEDGTLPVVIQFLRKKDKRGEMNNMYIRLDLFKVDFDEEVEDRKYFVLDERTNNTTFWGGADLCYRYTLEPGQYFMLPTTMEAGMESEFLIRIFSSVEISAEEKKTNPGIYIRRSELEFEHDGTKYDCCKQQNFFGCWKEGENAGGQIANRSFPTNPQYEFSIQGDSAIPLHVSLKQVNEEPQLPIGFKVYPLQGKGASAPADLRFLWNNANNCSKGLKGENGVFVIGNEGDLKFMLDPGNYVIVIFTDKPSMEKRYSLTVATVEGAELNIMPHNTV